MFPIVFDVTITGDGFTNKRALKKHLKLGYQAVLLLWLRRFFDRHFQVSAFNRYPSVYKQRLSDDPEKAVGQLKRRYKRDIRPNYESGRMHRELKSNVRLTGTAKGAKLVMSGPWYTDLAGTHNQPDKAAEISFVNASEQREMRRVFRDFLVRSINGDRTVRRIRIGAV